MLKSTKDHWKKKAEQEYEYAKAEEANWENLQQSQNKWKKRLEESSWLLKGAAEAKHSLEQVQVIDDKDVNNALGDRVKKMDMFALHSLDEKELKRTTSGGDKRKRRKGGSGSGGGGSGQGGGVEKQVRWSDGLTGMIASPIKLLNEVVSSDAAISRQKTPEELKKEREAQRRLESDERKLREATIKKSMEQIKVLEKVNEVLGRPKMPKHHRPAQVIETTLLSSYP